MGMADVAGGDAECARELRALKLQLHATLERMSDALSAKYENGAALQAKDEQQGEAEDDALAALRELTRVARSRGHLEANDIAYIKRGDSGSASLEGRPYRDRRRSRERRKRSLRRAIEEMRRKREEIERQIEADAAAYDREVLANKESNAPRISVLRERNGIVTSDATLESQYSIGGIVTLEPLQANGKVVVNSSRIPVHHIAPVQAAYVPRVVYPKTLDALNDVFSIQLKFAETMQQLEESIQARDHLLDRPLPRRMHRRPHHHHQPPKVLDTDQSLHSPNDLHRSSSFESDSTSDDDLVSSGVSTIVDLSRRYGHQQYRRESVETSQHASTPSSSDDTARHASSINSMAVTASVSAHTSPSVFRSSHASSPDQETPPRTRRPENPETSNAVHVTPSTGSSKKSDASSSKQVRFGQEEFPTPQITRKFSFGSSDDGDEDYESPKYSRNVDDSVADMSALSLLEGSSVHSSELNGESFLLAFEQFRHEVKGDLPGAPNFAPGSSSSSAARALFTTSSEFITPEKVKLSTSRLHEDDRHCGTVDFSAPELVVSPTTDRDASNASRDELQERRWQLCLDVQAESAKLALAFASDERQVDAIKARLLSLREQLVTIEAQLTAIA